MPEIEQIRNFVSRFEEIDGADDDTIIQKFNEILEETGKPYWFCKNCGRFHPREWVRCDLPCTLYEESKQITEEEWERLNDFFDPADYEQDPYFLRFPHTRLQRWMDAAEEHYNAEIRNLTNLKLVRAATKWGLENIVINDVSVEMTEFEKALRRFEIQRFRGVPTLFASLDDLLEYYIENAPDKE